MDAMKTSGHPVAATPAHSDPHTTNAETNTQATAAATSTPASPDAAQRKPFTVGITGGIGSGKSTVADGFVALGVPLVVVPLTQQYWDRVVSHSVAEIKEGRTPNPDMLCNSRWVFCWWRSAAVAVA